MENLRDLMVLGDQRCPECNYTGDKSESVARHLALYHNKLDLFLEDQDLVAEKRARAMAKPKKVGKTRNVKLLATNVLDSQRCLSATLALFAGSKILLANTYPDTS